MNTTKPKLPLTIADSAFAWDGVVLANGDGKPLSKMELAWVVEQLKGQSMAEQVQRESDAYEHGFNDGSVNAFSSAKPKPAIDPATGHAVGCSCDECME